MSDANLNAASVWRVEWGNEFPAEVDSIWTTEGEAQKRCDELNRKYAGWSVARWTVRVTWEAEA